ncbi:MAG TPA: hypothetical protein VLT33_50800 [Labilithrix sp.]|nr:hypothetical protein [Labilithrix sp.]
MRRSLLRCVLVTAAATALLACGSEPRVARVYDGRLVEGRYVSPEAYGAFLRGVLAEESGDLKGALGAYAQALDEDEDDPEISTRIGEARCKLDPKDPEIDKAFRRALALDATSASALAARSRCATARGNTAEAAELARSAAAQDPTNVGLAALAIRSEAVRGEPAARDRAIALTVAHGEHVAAWDALVAWGYGHKDAALVVRGLQGLVRVAPARSDELEKAAVALLVGGDAKLAAAAAVAVADSPRELGVVGPRDATVARLAVDEALARGDRATALARATRGHVPLAEVAARALLLDHRDVALVIASTVTDADPTSSGALMVKLALKAAPAPNGPAPKPGAPVPSAIPASLQTPSDQPPEICALVFADRLATTSGIETARTWLANVRRTPMSPRDPLASALASALAAKGVLPAPLRASE